MMQLSLSLSSLANFSRSNETLLLLPPLTLPLERRWKSARENNMLSTKCPVKCEPVIGALSINRSVKVEASKHLVLVSVDSSGITIPFETDLQKGVSRSIQHLPLITVRYAQRGGSYCFCFPRFRFRFLQNTRRAIASFLAQRGG